MIAALDNHGSMYISLMQSNSNSRTMELYYTHFITMLDKKNPNWRKDHIFMSDGAPYHTSKDMMDFYKKHQVPILFTGPHSYAASPIELFFAAFKRDDLNPNLLPLGK